MYGFENFPTINASYHLPTQHETFNAFYWIFANASNANTSSFDNSTFVQPIVKTLLQSMPNGTYYNVSVHTPVPGLDSRGYYGGRNNPTLNAVVKFWLCHDNNAVDAFRQAQLRLLTQNAQLGISLDKTFVFFTRAHLIYDRQTANGFSADRMRDAVLADRWRGDIAGPPVA